MCCLHTPPAGLNELLNDTWISAASARDWFPINQPLDFGNETRGYCRSAAVTPNATEFLNAGGLFGVVEMEILSGRPKRLLPGA